MSLRNDIVTISGNIGNDPVLSTTNTGLPVLNFRVGSSAGHWDRNTGEWRDGGTSWYAVSAFGALAENARGSLNIGNPVLVTGRLRIKEWENDGRKGVSADIVADAIGHDLNRGTSAFVRRMKSDAGTQATEASQPHAQEREYEEEDEISDEQRGAWEANGMHAPDATEAEPALA